MPMQNFTTDQELANECQICFDSKDIGFVRKCAHEICHSCARLVKKCPFCRGPMNLPLLDEKLNCDRFSPTPSLDYESDEELTDYEWDHINQYNAREFEANPINDYDSADDSSDFED